MEGERLMTESQWRAQEMNSKKALIEYNQKEYYRKEKLKNDIEDILRNPEIRDIIKDTFKINKS